MREAIGGTYTLYLFFAVIIVYVCFMGFIMNYASTYRASNYIITEIESHDGNIENRKQAIGTALSSKYGYVNSWDYCCSPVTGKSQETSGTIFTVRTVVTFDIPLIGIRTGLPITNDTKTIYNTSCGTIKKCSK